MFSLQTPRATAPVSNDAAAAKPREPSSRLRDSCQACAASKVKCPKEKPSCSRCESRGIPCQYFFIKPPGRRRDKDKSKAKNTAAAAAATKSNSSSAQSLSPSASNDFNRPGSEGDMIMAVAPPAPGGLLSLDMPPDPLLGLEGSAGNMSNLATTLSPPGSIVMDEISQEDFTIDDTLMSPLMDFGTETSDMEFFMSVMDNTQSCFLPTPAESTIISPTTRRDIASLLISCKNTQPGSTAQSISSTNSLSSPVLSFTPSDNPASKVQCLSEHGSCLVQALDFLKHLSSASTPPPSPATGSTASQNSMTTTAKARQQRSQHDFWAQGQLAESKTIIESISNMLTCSCCADDNFLLNIIGMTVLKLLARYAVVARMQGGGGGPQLDKSSSTSSRLARSIPPLPSGPRDDGDVLRMRAQLVLGELHPVQRLINELSLRLTSASEDVSRGSQETTVTAASLSAAILHQIEGDLRRSFSQLSAAIITKLRQS